MAEKLSPKKQRFVDFVREFTETNKRAPTFLEIMNGLQIKSPGTVNWYVRELEKTGVLRRSGTPNAKRALSIPETENTSTLPLLGLIAAGYPLEAIENQETIAVPPAYVHPSNYVLKVKGDSMIDDNIQEGDYIIVRQQAQAESGQTVVAFINNEATLKRYYPKTSGIELHPRNPAYPVIKVKPEDEFRLGGVVLAVWRRYE
ncbi:MAG TPA: transcriptional repressor LexA [Candidatus Marinimicrobia bacterium]|nr:transcriptional repressor LexA [Candidatus Neomarinimicrobiota bacterium]HRS51604.1 transcriptional repressor LexA [Candidatus Neomarinimicrobiota bacterium]